MATAAVVGELAKNLSSMLADKIIQEASLVTDFKEHFEFLCDELVSLQCLLNDAGEKRNSSSMSNWLDKLEDFLYDAVDIVKECGEPAKFCNPITFRYTMSRKIRGLRERIIEINQRAKYLKYLNSFQNVNANISVDPRERSSSFLAEKHSVGMEKDITKVTQLILEENGNQVIGVVGMGGQGKSLLVKHVLDSESVRQRFTHRFWLTISTNFVVEQLLAEMGRQIELDADKLYGNDVRTKIHEKLNNSCCLFVLDDVWQLNILDKINLPGLQDRSKILVTTREKRAVESMGVSFVLHTMDNLSDDDSMELFCRHAFSDLARQMPPKEMEDQKTPKELARQNLPKDLEDLAEKIVNKCGALPLALKTIGASMRRVRRLRNDWELTFNRLNETEAMSSQVMPSLTLSYHDLPAHLKLCFLYCSLFPKSTEIRSDYIVPAWIAEGFTPETATAEDAYDVGFSYVDELVDRGLIEVSKLRGNGRVNYFKLHDLLYDFALSEFNKQCKCLIRLGMELKLFPVDDCLRLRRISMIKNQILEINAEINSPGLRTLLLWNNMNLAQISQDFFSKLKYLAVLDLSQTSIVELPETVKNLKRLKLLNLSRTMIKKLPKSLADLPYLQFLDVSGCKDLSELHSGIGDHQSILHLNLKGCTKLEWLPRGVSKLIYLQKLKGAVFKHEEKASPRGLQLCSLFKRKNAANVEAFQLKDLKEFTRLQYLSLTLQDSSSEATATIQLEGIFKGMVNMRVLSFEYIRSSSTSGVSSNPLQLPDDITVMKRLETLHLTGCLLQKWVSELKNLLELKLDCDNGSTAAYTGLEKIPNLRRLKLSNNTVCTRIPEEFGERGAFPKLERLIIRSFHSLQNFPPRWDDEAMPELKKDSRIENCKLLEWKEIPSKLQKVITVIPCSSYFNLST